jgi:hypothetical protein
MSLIKQYLHSIQTQPMAAQFYTLNMLKDRVDSMIKEQGENAPVAWWIFTSEDVIKYDDNGDEVRQPDAVCGEVLSNLQEYDHIYTAIGDAIDNELGECV